MEAYGQKSLGASVHHVTVQLHSLAAADVVFKAWCSHWGAWRRDGSPCLPAMAEQGKWPNLALPVTGEKQLQRLQPIYIEYAYLTIKQTIK